MLHVRKEQSGDVAAIRRVNLLAFGQPREARMVDRIRLHCRQAVSLVALEGRKVLGHILFSPAVIRSGSRTLRGMGLAPMAVLPEHQRRGIGSRLVITGLGYLFRKQCPFVIVLGHPDYYPRFGFERAGLYGVRSEWEVPDEAFMILPLNPSALRGISGIAKYRPEFRQGPK
jgi:putative acetyltransferase